MHAKIVKAVTYEPPHKKTNDMHEKKIQLHSNCATQIFQSFIYLFPNFKLLSSFCDCTGRLVSDLVGNPKCVGY